MWKALACRVKGGRLDDPDPLHEFRGRDDFEILKGSYDLICRSATQPGSTVVSGWASELINTTAQQFGASLAPGIFGSLSTLVDGFDFDGTIPRIPARASTPKANGSFVGEGNPIPMRRIGLTSISLLPKKMGVLTEYTSELLRSSTPNIEAVLRTEVSRDTREALDTVLIDTTAADATRPAGIRNGIAGLTASAATASYDKMIADLKALLAAIAPSVRPVLLVNAAQALGLQWTQSPPELGPGFLTTIVSPIVPAGMVIALDLDSFAYAMDAPRFELAKVGLIHEEDTNPQAIGTAGSPNVVAAPSRSIWQTDVQSLRLILFINWSLTRSNGVAWINAVGW